MEWFTVDKQGLAKLLERKGKAFIVYELLQNAWDTDASDVSLQLTPIPNKPFYEIIVTDDDPKGFSTLAHAFTLFAESEKKNDPTKRGRFNLGEKLVLALCSEASVTSTTGTVRFDADGRHTGREKTEKGSVFKGVFRMTRAEADEVVDAVKRLIAPRGKQTTFNGEYLPEREQEEAFVIPLATEIADDEGVLRRSVRNTLVSLYNTLPGETAMLYEMGIPVVELTGGEPWHINIHQKIPLNTDRDNVTPAYRRDLRTAVLNEMHEWIKGEDAREPWVREAAGDPNASPQAVAHVKVERFGEKAVAADPSDVEGTKIAASEGYTVIPGGAMSKGEWENVKRDRLVLPAGQVTPSRPEGVAETKYLEPNEWSEGMKGVAALAVALGAVLVDKKIQVNMCEAPTASIRAMWAGTTMTFNVSVLGKKWFEKGPTEDQISLIIHELGHNFESDHLSKEYYRALTRLGARLALYIHGRPDFLKPFLWGKW